MRNDKKMVNIFKAMGEPTRLKILKLISVREMCVCELVEVLGITQPGVSQHLKVLKKAGIIQEKKAKQRSFYSLASSMNDILCSFNSYITADIADIDDLRLTKEILDRLDINENVTRCKNKD